MTFSFVLCQAQEDLSKQLINMKALLFGTESEQQSDIVLAQLSQEMYNTGNEFRLTIVRPLLK